MTTTTNAPRFPLSMGFCSAKNFRALSINQQLEPLFYALSMEKDRRRKDLGASVFGFDDIFKRLQPFLATLRTQFTGVARGRGPGDGPPLRAAPLNALLPACVSQGNRCTLSAWM